ncbi:ATP-binding protein [Anabaena azotica]|uniref:ATP-binding protein n=1 Tax=Anabaena azotica TaxID=197653 RepID=UPI0039A477E2
MFQANNSTINQSLFQRLPRSMSYWETWAFGVTAHLSWTSVVPIIHHALGTQAIFVYVPAVIFGMVLNYQVKHLGKNLLNVAGGTPNYTTQLWHRYPIMGKYSAIGYILGWLSFLTVNSLVLTDIIKVNLEGFGISFPDIILKVGFTLIPFIVAFSGTRALSVLHLFFALPAFLLLLIFCVQGLGFLTFSGYSPGFVSHHGIPISFMDWAKWFFIISYSTYACETASSFVADSLRPEKTLKFLDVAAWLMPIVFIGGSWVIMYLATGDNLGDSPFLNFVAASHPFWGEYASIIATFLLAGSCLLGSATAVSNCPRILYQLAIDKHIAPVFSTISPRGVFGSGLALSLFLSLLYLSWGDLSRLVVVGNVSWFVSFIILHLGLWRQRHKPEVLFPKVALGLFILEFLVLIVAGYAWGWQDFLIGLLAPFGVLIIDAFIRYTSLPIFRSSWWIKIYKIQRRKPAKDSLMLQVSILIFLLCSAVFIGYLFGFQLNINYSKNGQNLIVILLMLVAFGGVAIACWTSLPEVISLTEARESAEHLFMVAQDCILVVNENGIIQQINPATESFFKIETSQLIGHHLQTLLPELKADPVVWLKRSEHTLNRKSKVITLEVSISDRTQEDFQEYVVIVHDITQRKQAEEILRQSEAQLRKEAQQLASQLVQSEKLSSLGQLVAGIAHEINNPINFIYGNLDPANQYIHDLMILIQLYEQHYPQPKLEIQNAIQSMDLNFILSDLPKLLNSMEVGSRRIKEIVLSLRNFSRLDESEMKAVNIHEGIDSTLMILQSRLKPTSDRPGIEIIKQYGQLPPVECYPGQLNQVFMNILVNGIDAIEEALLNGYKINQPQIEIQTQLTNENQVIISIKDNGAGIPENVKNHLFDPFFTTKPVGKGTGLGLSISYQIITEKHSGNLKCISELDVGAEFIIMIPLEQQKVPSQLTYSSDEKSVGGRV